MYQKFKDYVLLNPKSAILLGITIIFVALALISCAKDDSITKLDRAVQCKEAHTC